MLESAKLLLQKQTINNNIEVNESESESEPESDEKKIKYIKKQTPKIRKHKHPSRKTIIFESSSDISSDSSSDSSETNSEPEFIIKKK